MEPFSSTVNGRWDSVKTDVGKVGARTEEAQDRERCRTIIDEAKTLQRY
jgi:hypothetical protein